MSTEKLKRTPSLLHLVKLIGHSPKETARNILKLRDAGPRIRNFEARYYHIKLLQGMAPDKILRQAEIDRREHVRKAALETLPLLLEYLDRENLRWFKETREFQYRVTADIVIPFKLLGLAGVDGQIIGLFSQIWKGDTANAIQFNIWASVVYRGLILQNPDVTDFHWLEMSAPPGTKKRELRVRSLSAASLLSDEELLEVQRHVEAAMLIVENTPKKDRPKKKDEHPGQGSFKFEDDEDSE